MSRKRLKCCMDQSGKDAQGDGIVAPGEAWGEGGGYRRSAACGTYKKRVSGNFWRAAVALRSQGEGAWEGPQVLVGRACEQIQRGTIQRRCRDRDDRE